MLDKKRAKGFGLFMFGVLMIFMLAAAVAAVDPAIPVADAQSSSTTTTSPDGSLTVTTTITRTLDQGKDVAKKVVTGVFGYTPDNKSPFDLAFPKFLVFLLITVIIYGISEMLPFFSDTGDYKMYIRLAFSGIVAFLSVLYVTPQEIYDSLTGYGAMAVVLTAIIPFMIILAVYAKLAVDPDPWKVLVAKTLGISFVVYLIYRIIILWIFSPKDAWSGAVFVTALMLGIMIILITFDERLKHFFLKMKMKGYVTKINLMSETELLGTKAVLEEKRNALLAKNAPANIIKDINDTLASIEKQILSVK